MKEVWPLEYLCSYGVMVVVGGDAAQTPSIKESFSTAHLGKKI